MKVVLYLAKALVALLALILLALLLKLFAEAIASPFSTVLWSIWEAVNSIC